MDNAERLARAAGLLLDIEAEMRRIGLWDAVPPDPEAFSSILPFCYDTLSFPQWLQFVFVVRMKALIEAQAELPTACSIAPMAEEAFGRFNRDTEPLLCLLQWMDEALSLTEGSDQTSLQ